MSKIAIVEVTAVRHFVASLCRIAIAGGNEVVLFVTPAIYAQLREEIDALGIRVELTDAKASLLRNLRQLGGRITAGGFDHCIINTYRAWEFLWFRPRTTLLVRKYNMNWFFKDTKLAGWLSGCGNFQAWRLRDPIRNALSGWLVRRLMLRAVDAVLVEYPPFVDYVRTVWGPKPPAMFLPLTYFEADAAMAGRGDQRIDDKVRFVIPGIVSEDRRDYDTVLSVFESLFERYGTRISLALLGSAESTVVIRRCDAMRARGFDVVYSTDDFVPTEIYERGLREADMVIAPLKLAFRYREVRETYTESKGSGFFADCLRFGKPCIVPRACTLPAQFLPAYLRYTDGTDLLSVLSRLIECEAELRQIQSEALRVYAGLSLPGLGRSLNTALETVRHGGTAPSAET